MKNTVSFQIKASEKRLKLLEYLKNSIGNDGFIFLQETQFATLEQKIFQVVSKD